MDFEGRKRSTKGVGRGRRAEYTRGHSDDASLSRKRETYSPLSPLRASSCLPSCINLNPRTSPSLNVFGVAGEAEDDEDSPPPDDDDDDDVDAVEKNREVVRVPFTIRHEDIAYDDVDSDCDARGMGNANAFAHATTTAGNSFAMMDLMIFSRGYNAVVFL